MPSSFADRIADVGSAGPDSWGRRWNSVCWPALAWWFYLDVLTNSLWLSSSLGNAARSLALMKVSVVYCKYSLKEETAVEVFVTHIKRFL